MAGKVLFPANPDLADVLGRTNADVESFHFAWIPNFQISRFLEIWPGPGLGRAWAKSLGEPVQHEGGTALSANPTRYPFFIVTLQASLVGE